MRGPTPKRCAIWVRAFVGFVVFGCVRGCMKRPRSGLTPGVTTGVDLPDFFDLEVGVELGGVEAFVAEE